MRMNRIAFGKQLLRTFGNLSKVLTNFALVLFLIPSAVNAAGAIVDENVIKEIAQEFVPFNGLSADQYYLLKRKKDPQLLKAQRLVSDYIRSTSFEFHPYAAGVGREGWEADFESRGQLFNHPLIIQTALELVSHEIMKQDQADCEHLANTLRFISVGLDPRGQVVPGIDHNRNLLLSAHLSAAYSKLKLKFQDGLTCSRTGFTHAENTYSVDLLVRAFAGQDGELKFSGGFKAVKYGLLYMRQGEVGYYQAQTSIVNTQGRKEPAVVVYQYANPRPTKEIFHSGTFFRPLSKSVPTYTSNEVLKMYSDFAEDL